MLFSHQFLLADPLTKPHVSFCPVGSQDMFYHRYYTLYKGYNIYGFVHMTNSEI